MAAPADDAPKLFVGQVPRDWDADALRSALEEAGSVHEVIIVRDRGTGLSKGCAFVTYNTPEETEKAIKLFHGTRVLPGAKNPMQVKVAEGQEAKVASKVFVGMLPRTVTEEQLRARFEPFGSLLEASILKGPGNVSKGSAFVRFQRRAEAQAAINALHQREKWEGSEKLMVVKWAENEKEKMERKAQRAGMDMGMGMGMYNGAPMGSPGLAPYPPYPPQNFQAPLLYPPAPYPGYAEAPGAVPGYYGAEYYNQVPYPGYGVAPAPVVPTAMPGVGPGAVGAAAGPTVENHKGAANTSASVVAAAIREKLVQKEGPPGANLFVYNIPLDWGDQDLATTFSEFGNVTSTKVFVDKATGVSKGFGFVSFTAAEAADAAIAVMDGFLVGGKKLKVSIKKGPASPGVAAGAGGGAAPPAQQPAYGLVENPQPLYAATG